MNYLLDSNTYIQAKNLHYGMSFCPAYWDWLDLQFDNGQIASMISVYEELAGFGDELGGWIKQRQSQFLTVDDDATQSKYV